MSTLDKDRSISNIVVLGGGTAGWLTALYAKRVFPDKKITVIESEEIGILGAGEGSTPHLISLLDILNIPVSDLVKETGATFKIGILFKNWSKERPKSQYLHPFTLLADFNLELNSSSVYVSDFSSLFAAGVYLDKNLNPMNLALAFSEVDKVPFFYDKELFVEENNRIFDYHHLSNFGIHFDARRLAEFLRNTAVDRGIVRVEGIVSSVEQDSSGDVKKLILENGKSIDSDFIFDCSGFRRFFQKLFESEWVDLSKSLPVSAALPFFLEMNENSIPSVTEAIAMDYGWMWKIPLQERFGCGYVFDESLITEDQAKTEVETLLGIEIDPLKTIRFKAGYYKTPWVHNVLSVGLSSGFIEPLEATSIWSSIFYAKYVLSSPELIYSRDPRISKDFNEYASILSEEIAAFVNFHYMGQRDDTEFWKKFTRESCVPLLNKYLDILDYRSLRDRDNGALGVKVWDTYSWYFVGEGIDYPNFKNSIEKYYFYNNFRSFFKDSYLRYKSQRALIPQFVDHKDLINNLKEL